MSVSACVEIRMAMHKFVDALSWVPRRPSRRKTGSSQYAEFESLETRQLLTLGDEAASPFITGPAALVSQLRPTVTWNGIAGATEYEVWIKNQSTGVEPLTREAGSGTTFTPSSDLGIGNFTVWVRALGANGDTNSPWSTPHNFRIKAPVTQSAVTVNPVNGLPTIAWQALPGAETYDVWIDRLNVPTSQILRDTDVSGTSLSPTNLPRGSYRVWVRGIAAHGADGAWSAAQDFSTAPVPAPIITGGLNPTFDTTPTITWTAVAGASTYEVYILSIQGNSKALHQTNINDTSFTSPALPAGPYRYWVRVTGATVWSNPVEIDTTGRTNVLGPIGNTTDRTPTISWQPVDEAIQYELWVNELGVRDKIIYRTSLTTTSFTPTSNLAAGSFRVWVRAVSSSVTAPWSAPVDFAVADAAAPLTPSNESDLLASVFSDSELLPVLSNYSELSMTRIAEAASRNKVIMPETPEISALVPESRSKEERAVEPASV